MAKSFVSAALAVAMTMVATPAGLSAKSPSDQVLTASSPSALLVIRTDFWQPAPSLKSAFKLSLTPYDPVEGRLLGGGVLVASQEKKLVEGHLVIPIKPGRWTIVSYQEQDHWALCFNAASVQFEVKPGEVVFLGHFDAQTHRRQLAEKVVESGKVSISGYGFADYFDLPNGPYLTPSNEADLDNVRAMLARKVPQVTAPVRAADYTAAKFGTGSTLFGERRCGGYFRKGIQKNGS